MHRDRRPVPHPLAGRLHVAGADQPDRHDRSAGAQRQPGDAGAELVQPAVGGAGALGEDAQRAALPEQVDADVDRRGRRPRVAALDRHLAHPSKNAAIARPRTPGVVKYSALAK